MLHPRHTSPLLSDPVPRMESPPGPAQTPHPSPRSTTGLKAPPRQFAIAAAILAALAASVSAMRRGIAAPATKPAASTTTLDFDRDIHPLLETYCTSCHNPDKHKGDLDLLAFSSSDKAAAADAELWPLVARRLSEGEMPPAKSKQPTDTEKSKLLSWLGTFAAPGIDCTPEGRARALSRLR